jgi:monofunctional biosynthetic peptidoglycan transglycosylase
MNEPPYLITFGGAAHGAWRAVNDGVMGGVSRGNIRRTARNTGVFEGSLSLENNGGFASVRTPLQHRDLSAYDGLEVRVFGDGRTYQLRLRTDDVVDGVAYRADVETCAGEWITSRIAFNDFVPTYRGRRPAGAAPLDTARIHQIAFMLVDKRPGSFSLEIDHVRAWNFETPEP